MTSLITGGAGFIGEEVVRLLLARGEGKPVIFSRSPSTKQFGELSGDIDAIAGDLGNYDDVLSAVERSKPDVIYHIGAMLPNGTESDTAGGIQANAMGTFHVLEAARLSGVNQVLFASSFGVYGDGIDTPEIGDNSPQFPRLLYGITKVFGEQLGLYYRRNHGVDFRGIRYPFIIGATGPSGGFSGHYYSALTACVKGDPYTALVEPDFKGPTLYIKDAARVIVDMGKAPVDRIKTVNYGLNGIAPTPTAQEVVDMIKAKIPGAQIDFKPKIFPADRLGDIFKPYDDSAAQNEWGWKVEYDLKMMLDDIFEEIRRTL